jgi:putative peptide zinc metalloprotease protein
MRRLVLLLLGALVVTAAVAPRASGQGDTTAVAVNTRDGADVFRLAFSIRRVLSETVDTSNAAVAVSSCTDCQTVALAFQVLLLFENPEELTPENLALALNVECTLCDTLASAYQLVLTTGGPVHFSAEGNQRLADIRRRLLELRDSGLGSFELQARVDALYEELRQVVATELTAAPRPDATDGTDASTTTTAGSNTTTTESTGSTGTTSSTTSSSTTTTTTSTTTTETTS